MRVGSPLGVPSAPGAGPSILYGMSASCIIERRRRLRSGPAAAKVPGNSLSCS
jgi:hypothetical protein